LGFLREREHRTPDNAQRIGAFTVKLESVVKLFVLLLENDQLFNLEERKYRTEPY
jgi:hypothetical protein